MQDQNVFRPPASQPGPKQVIIKGASRARKGKSKQSPSKKLLDPVPGDELRQQLVAAPVAAAHRAMFAERLHDAQRIEDLFEVNLTGVLHVQHSAFAYLSTVCTDCHVHVRVLLFFATLKCGAQICYLSQITRVVQPGYAKSILSMVHSACVLLLQLVRDAEMLTASEVALLPLTLLQLYKERSAKEQQAVATHAFFDSLTKPWALEPSKLSTQVS